MELWIRGVTPEPFGLRATVLTGRRWRLAVDCPTGPIWRDPAELPSRRMRTIDARSSCGRDRGGCRRLVSLLVTAGRQVTGLTGISAKAAEIERAGATAAVADVLDGQLVHDLVFDARPEVVIHEMTALANASDLTHFDRSFAMTNRLRTEGLDHLLAAARRAGRAGSSHKAFAAGLTPGREVRSKRKRSRSTPIRRVSSAIRWMRSDISKMRLPARRIWKGSCCAMALSMGRARDCSTDQRSMSFGAGACR